MQNSAPVLALLCALALVLSAGCVDGDDGDGDGNGDGNASGGAGSGSNDDGSDDGGDDPGDDGSGGNSGSSTTAPMVDTGLPDDALLSDLDADDARIACETLNEQADQALSADVLAQIACITSGAIAGMDFADPSAPFDVAACEAAVDECLSIPGEVTSESMCDSATVQTELAECNVTVAQFEACYTAALAGTVAAIELLTCENIAADPTGAMLEAEQDELANPAECEVVDANCPALSPQGDGGGGPGEPAPNGCDNTCGFASDGDCDDGGPDADFAVCALGTDCDDCGQR